jgi:hypothetical protein
VKFLIFFKIFYKVQSVEVWSQDPVNKNNSNSFMLTNLELKFEVCMFNLIWKWGAKDPKKREDHLIFINFGVKKFTLQKPPKNKTLTFECYNLLNPMEMRSWNFWRLMFNKVTSRSYSYFLKFSYFFWWRNGLHQVGQKLQKLVKKTDGILGVKPFTNCSIKFEDSSFWKLWICSWILTSNLVLVIGILYHVTILGLIVLQNFTLKS